MKNQASFSSKDKSKILKCRLLKFLFGLSSHKNIIINPFKPNGFFHSYYLEKTILHFRGVRLTFSSLA